MLVHQRVPVSGKSCLALQKIAKTCSVFNTIDGLESLIANFLLVANSVLSMKAPGCGERQHVPASMQVLALCSACFAMICP